MGLVKANNKYFIFSGRGSGTEELLSFDNALINAKVANYNLVKISSILPPHYTSSDMICVVQGSVLFTAYASITKKGEGLISASIAVGIPNNASDIGVIMEFSGFCPKETSEQKVIDMVASAMKTRKIQVNEIKSMSIETYLSNDQYSSVIAGISLW